MKIKEALITCINGMDNNESLYGAFAFTHFAENLASIQVNAAARLLTRNMSKMRIEKKMREAEREYLTMLLLLLIYSVSSKAEICPAIYHYTINRLIFLNGTSTRTCLRTL